MTPWRYVAALVAVVVSTCAAAQEYPSRTIQVIVPNAAGSWDDSVSRIVFQKLEQVLGQSLIIINRPNALGMLALDECMRSDGDGYTLCQGNFGHMVVLVAASMAAGENPPYDPGKRLAPIGQIAETQYAFVSGPSFPGATFDTIAANVRRGKKAPLFATQGPFAVLAAEILKSVLGIDIVKVAYGNGGDAQAMNDLVAGNVDLKVGAVLTIKPFLESGKCTVLGVFAGRGRSEQLAYVPTMHELGYSEFDLLSSWSALWTPKTTPDAIIRKLNTALNVALRDPSVQASLENLGVTTRPGPPGQPTELRKVIPPLAEFIREHNIKLFGK